MPEVIITYKGRDEVSKPLKSATDSLKNASTAVGGLNKGSKDLDATTGRLNKGVRGLTSSISGMQALVGAAAVTMGVNFVSSMIGANAEIGRMSETLGIGTDTLQELQFAAKQSGTSLESVSDVSRTFSERILEVKAGAKMRKSSLIGSACQQTSLAG